MYVLSIIVSEKIEKKDGRCISASAWKEESNSPLVHFHILINVYWNKYGLIQTKAANDIVVYSFLAWLITEFITMHSVHLPFQCSKVYRLHSNYHMTKNNQDNSFNFRFQIGNGRQSKRLHANLGRILHFHYLSFLIKTGIRTHFLLDIYFAYTSFFYEQPL
jgi:hypothetical protein